MKKSFSLFVCFVWLDLNYFIEKKFIMKNYF